MVLWPFENNKLCSPLHLASRCTQNMMMMMMIHLFRRLSLDILMLAHTITWFYQCSCPLNSVVLCICTCPSFCYPPLYISPPPPLLLPALYIISLSLSLSVFSFACHTLPSFPAHSLASPVYYISLRLGCFCCDAVIRLSILILSCQCRAVHSE